MRPPRLIASDIDGTLINHADRVPKRVREVIARADSAGTEVLLATGRPHRWIYTVLEQLSIRPICVTSNGAVLYDSAADRVIQASVIAPEIMREVYELAQEALADFGGARVAAERVGHSSLDKPEDVFVMEHRYLNTWAEQGFGLAPVEEVLDEPAVKMILRNEHMSAPQMYELLAPHVDDTRAHVTYSMNDGLLEVAAPGVTKASGVSALCEMHGVEQSSTIAFGDMPNDIEMLSWVNHGVAVANAAQAVKDAADEVTGTNDEGGIAMTLERWF